MDYKVKKQNRDAKVKARRTAMPVSGRSVFVILQTIGKKAKQSK